MIALVATGVVEGVEGQDTQECDCLERQWDLVVRSGIDVYSVRRWRKFLHG